MRHTPRAQKIKQEGTCEPLLAEGLIRSAEEAGLRYVSDWKPGIRRRRNRKGFSYLTADGTAVRDDGALEQNAFTPAKEGCRASAL